MTDREQFLFDLQGFLVVRDFLSGEEVAALNAALDANTEKKGEDGNSVAGGNLDGDFKRGMFNGMLTWDKPHCLPFRNLLAHPKVISYLNTQTGSRESMGRSWTSKCSP